MQIQCPNCSRTLDVPDSSAGQVMPCPGCGGQMQVPAAAAPEPLEVLSSAPPAAAEPTKKCPFCGETILQAARKCKHCKADIPEGLDAESVRMRLETKEKALRSATPERTGGVRTSSFWSRFRTGTYVCGSLTLLFGLMFLIGVMGEGDSLVALTVLGVIFGIICGIAFLVFLGGDLSVPALSKRLTPEKGMAAFIKGLAAGRHEHAYACLLEGDKDALERTRRAIPEVRVSEAHYSFATLEGFKSYWKGICRASGGYSRRMVISRIAAVETKANYALVRATGRLESYPLLALLGAIGGIIPLIIVVLITTKRQEMEMVKLLRKVGDQWCVVNGELDSPEDRALEVAAGLATGSSTPSRIPPTAS